MGRRGERRGGGMKKHAWGSDGKGIGEVGRDKEWG